MFLLQFAFPKVKARQEFANENEVSRYARLLRLKPNQPRLDIAGVERV